MVKRCQWGLCDSDDRYPERLEGGVVFIPFPKPTRNLEKCKRWIKACNRIPYQLNVDNIKGNYHMYVCTKHFPEGRPTDQFPDPIPAITSPSKAPAWQAHAKLPPTEEVTEPPPKKQKPQDKVVASVTVVNEANEPIFIYTPPTMSTVPSTQTDAQPGNQQQHALQLIRSMQQKTSASPLPVNLGSQSGGNIGSAYSSLVQMNSKSQIPLQSLSNRSVVPQSKYAELLAVIEDMGRDIRPTYSGSRTATERLKRGIVHSRALVRECLAETERSARS